MVQVLDFFPAHQMDFSMDLPKGSQLGMTLELPMDSMLALSMALAILRWSDLRMDSMMDLMLVVLMVCLMAQVYLLVSWLDLIPV